MHCSASTVIRIQKVRFNMSRHESRYYQKRLIIFEHTQTLPQDGNTMAGLKPNFQVRAVHAGHSLLRSKTHIQNRSHTNENPIQNVIPKSKSGPAFGA